MKALLGTVGLASLFFILRDYGFAKLLQDISLTGWWVFPLLFSFVPVLLLYSLAWHLVTPEKPWRAFPHLFRLMIISIAWNNLSPFIKVFGEPIKITALTPNLGRRTAIKSILLYNLVHIYGTVLAFVLGAILLLWCYHVPSAYKIGFVSLIGVFLVALAAIYFLPKAKKRKRSRRKNGLVRKVNLWLHWSLSKIRVFNKNHPGRLLLAVFLETLARFVEGVTFFFAFYSLKHPISLSASALLDVGRALLDNLFFFIPYQVGSREAGLIFLTERVMNLQDCPQVSAAILYRLVEVIWILIGYLLWMNSAKSRKS